MTLETRLDTFLERLVDASSREDAWQDTVTHFNQLGFQAVLSIACDAGQPGMDGSGRGILASADTALIAVIEDRSARLHDPLFMHLSEALHPLLLSTDSLPYTPRLGRTILPWIAAETGYGGMLVVPVRLGPAACASGMILLSRREPTAFRDFASPRILDLAYAAVQAHLRVWQFVRTEGRQRPSLTNREREVLALSAQGLTTRQVGTALGISISGVNFHISNASRKLGANNRTHATSLAIANGLILI